MTKDEVQEVQVVREETNTDFTDGTDGVQGVRDEGRGMREGLLEKQKAQGLGYGV